MERLRSIVFIVGIFLLLFSLAMLILSITNKCLSYEWKNFLAGFIITCTSGVTFILFGKSSRLHGMPAIFAITSCTWITLSYFDNLRYVDAVFEAISGFTITGATIFDDIEKQSPGILLWRTMLHGIGGFGVITLGIAVFPRLKIFSPSNLL